MKQKSGRTSRKVLSLASSTECSCTRTLNSSAVKVSEKGRKAVFRNESRSEYEVTEIDGCLIRERLRTDCLVSKKGSASVLVELKGKNVSHACEQLFATVANSKVAPLLHGKIGFLVICSKFPRFDSYVIKSKQMAAKKFKAGFHVVCDSGEFDIERVVAIDGPR